MPSTNYDRGFRYAAGPGRPRRSCRGQSARSFAELSGLGWVLAARHHRRGREYDLIYEAYYHAFRSDIPADAGDQLPGRWLTRMAAARTKALSPPQTRTFC